MKVRLKEITKKAKKSKRRSEDRKFRAKIKIAKGRKIEKVRKQKKNGKKEQKKKRRKERPPPNGS